MSFAVGNQQGQCCLAGLALQRPKVAAIPVEFTGEGQMLLNSLQVVEVLADDSNFRQTAMERLAAPLAQALSFRLQTLLLPGWQVLTMLVA